MANSKTKAEICKLKRRVLGRFKPQHYIDHETFEFMNNPNYVQVWLKDEDGDVVAGARGINIIAAMKQLNQRTIKACKQ